MKVLAAVPVLCVRDLERACLFYGRLGFEVRARFSEYALLEREGARLHLRVAHPEENVLPERNPCGAYLFVQGLDQLAKAWEAAGVSLLSWPADQPWGVREFALSDEDGNLLRVGELLES